MRLRQRDDCTAIAGMENKLAWTTGRVASFRRLLQFFAGAVAIGNDLLGHRRYGGR
ncbi:hypothetical protein [Stenotrophomonas pavanii]|uniref:hypothetical protein n=1 Tax=Stenotrophomonas pavanii TaxID=487698 RepID=UPI0021750AA5|nr:hypothetical protein [Stenotrophomonas pavanii]